jgi:hypothetical protein
MALCRPFHNFHSRLMTACRWGDLSTVQSLCQLATSQTLLFSSDIQELVHYASRCNHKPIVEYLCELDLSLAASPRTRTQFDAYKQGVMWAASCNVLSVMRFLCELALSRPTLGITPAFDDNRPLRWAMDYHSRSVVRYLCELAQSCPCSGIDPAAKDNFAIKQAAKYGWAEMVRHLCEHPTVDPAAVLRMDPQPPADILEIVCDALAQRRRWSSLRAAFVAAVVNFPCAPL